MCVCVCACSLRDKGNNATGKWILKTFHFMITFRLIQKLQWHSVQPIEINIFSSACMTAIWIERVIHYKTGNHRRLMQISILYAQFQSFHWTCSTRFKTKLVKENSCVSFRSEPQPFWRVTWGKYIYFHHLMWQKWWTMW